MENQHFTSGQVSQIYRYEPITAGGTIRVLDLQETQGDRLECSISQITLADGGFHALSYEWGILEQHFKILVRGRDQDGLTYIPLTRNLFDALRDLRDCTDIEPKRFWIDQICINQEDNEEKGHQVGLMADIYRKASRVITYLGPQSNDLETENGALELLDLVTKHFEPGILETALTMPRLARTNPRLVPLVITPGSPNINLEEPYWVDLLRIVYSGWAQRLWMVQENILCPDTVMLRGRRLLNWVSVASIPIYFHMNMLPIAFLEEFWPSLNVKMHPNTVNAAVTIPWRLRLENEHGGRGSLLRGKLALGTTVTTFSNLGCKDPRDRVYAMLGISTDADQLGIVPNYQLPASEVFTDMSMRIYLGYQNLTYLSNLADLDNSDLSMPTWSYRLAPGIEAMIPSSKPHPSRHNRITFEAQNKVMVVKGRIIDRIAIITPAPPYMQISADGKRTFAVNETSRQLLISSALILDHLGVSVGSLSALLHAWTSDQSWPSDSDDLECAYYFWCKYINCAHTLANVDNTIGNEPWSSPKVISTLKSISEVLKSRGKQVYDDPMVVIDEGADLRRISRQVDGRLYCRGRSFCISEEKRVCNATGKVKKGDMIALLAGGDAYLLRPLGDKYQYVGTVWTDGLMNGEAYENVLPEEVDYDIRLV